MHFLTDKFAARIDDEEAELGVCAEFGADLAEMRVGIAFALQDHPGDLSPFAELQVGDNRGECGETLWPTWRSMTVAFEPLPKLAGKRRCSWPAACTTAARSALRSRFVGQVEREAVTHEGAVQAADRVIGVESGQAFCGAPSVSASR